MDIKRLNQKAWDQAVDEGTNPYTQVVSAEAIARARRGEWQVYLSDCKPVPATWFPPLAGLRVLCLASGGGQQAPIFAAAGAVVTLLDVSQKQLAQDGFVAQRESLPMDIMEGDMADLSAFGDGSFDLIFNPPSTLFVPEVAPVWRECARTLREGGVLMSGFMNPDEFIFDVEALDNEGRFVVKHRLPYVEHETLDEDALRQRIAAKVMLHFSHSMEAQLGGMIAAGFVIDGFYEDRRPEESGNPIFDLMPSYFVVKGIRRPNPVIPLA